MDDILARGLILMLEKNLNFQNQQAKKEPTTSPEEHFMNAKSFFDSKKILNHFHSIESDQSVLKKDIRTIMKLHMCHLEENGTSVDILKFIGLCTKYRIKESENRGPFDISFGNILWTFPDFGYYQIKKHPQFKFPWSDELIKDYPTFKVKYQNPGLLGLMPKGKKYGGLAKVLVDLAYLVSVRVKNVDACVGIARAIYCSSLASDERREKWFPTLEISETECAVWSKIFDRKYPSHVDIYKYFDQVA